MIFQEKNSEYIRKCCQSTNGGLRDKPGKAPDFYHTCYCLSGLSLSQNMYNLKNGNEVEFIPIILEEECNRLKATHPIHNISFEHVDRIKNWFQ
jgi:protein farnesyltransferase subunit beta